MLVVAASDRISAVLEQSGFRLEHVRDPQAAIERVDAGERADVMVLAPGIADPVRVAQRLHSLDRDGAVVVLADPDAEAEIAHALSVAPFLSGDVALHSSGDPDLPRLLAEAGERTRERRLAAGERKTRRETPPPLSARYLGTLLDSVPIGLVTLDATGSVIGWNRRAGDMLEVPEVEALGHPVSQLFDEGDQPRLSALIGRLAGAGIDEDPEVFHRGGRSFEITGARFAIRSGEGGTLLILQDVTKRERAEAELRLQKALSDAQADTAVAGIVVMSLDNKLERANRRFGEIWGISADEMRRDPEGSRQKLLDQVVDPDSFVTAPEELSNSPGTELRDEVRLKDGRTIERYATHVHGPDGEPIGRIWFHTDITAHRREEESLRFLADATNLLSSSLDYRTTLQHIADLAVPRMADWCTVEIVEGNVRRNVAVAHVEPGRLEAARVFRKRYPDVESGTVPQVIATGEPLVFEHIDDAQLDALAQSDAHREMLEAVGLSSAMVIPIKVRDRIYGAINLCRIPGSADYDADDVALATELARRAAIAIDNSRVHAELREVARTLQESLLPPHLPAIRGLELAARFRPAGAGMQVGGDFYDIFDTVKDRWSVVIGDVCGKGAQAAALTALTRYTVRAAAMYEAKAGGVLRVLNEALLRQRGDFRFTTLAYCTIDLGADTPLLSVASGGHPRPLILRTDGTVEAVGAGGPLLGVVRDAEFDEETAELREGDALVLYTDGLTDALAPQKLLDENDLMAALANCRGMGAGEISMRLEQVALASDPDRAPRDDIALVVAKLS